MSKKRTALFIFLTVSAYLHAQISTTCVPSVSIMTSAVNGSICIGQTATYTVSGGVTYTFVSTPSASPSFTGATGAVSPTTHTSYQVIGTNQFGCTSSAQQIIFVNQLPQISIVASPTMICFGGSSTLTATGAPSGTTHIFSWAHGGDSAKSVVNPPVATIYTVTGTNTITSCQNTKTISVAVFNPTFATSPDTAVCKGNSITLSASGANSFTWAGGPTPGNGPLYLVSPTVATIYTVGATTWTVNGAIKCNSTKTISVGIYPQPTVSAFASRTLVCHGILFDLFATGAQTYYWPTINQTGSFVTVPAVSQKIYKVVGTSNYGCKDSAQILILYSSDCPEMWMGLDKARLSPPVFVVFPNPSVNSFEVETTQPCVLYLRNLEGVLVKELYFNSAGIHNVSTIDLVPGTYFISGLTGGMFFREKVVIRR